jgi:hypothetical protein
MGGMAGLFRMGFGEIGQIDSLLRSKQGGTSAICSVLALPLIT